MISAKPAPDFGPWVHSRLGLIVGKDGKGGSGTRIQLEDGSDALLTARHVVIDCILTGSMTVGCVGDKETVIPKRIRIASRTDAAYIVSSNPNPLSVKLSFADWTTPSSNISPGLVVCPSGFPGSWKQADVQKNALPFIRALVYGTTLSNPPMRGDFIICNVDETDEHLPPTFAGMSGGPLFSLDKKFLGVLVHEGRSIGGSGQREIQVAPVQELKELHGPLQSPLTDYMRQKVWAPTLSLVHLQNPRRKAQLEVHGDMYWSESQPDAPFGRMGRIQMIRFLTPPGAEQYPINTESVFYPKDGTEDERKRAFDEELRFLLGRVGWGIEGPTL